jgi:hypothetical protein
MQIEAVYLCNSIPNVAALPLQVAIASVHFDRACDNVRTEALLAKQLINPAM